MNSSIVVRRCFFQKYLPEEWILKVIWTVKIKSSENFVCFPDLLGNGDPKKKKNGHQSFSWRCVKLTKVFFFLWKIRFPQGTNFSLLISFSLPKKLIQDSYLWMKSGFKKYSRQFGQFLKKFSAKDFSTNQIECYKFHAVSIRWWDSAYLSTMHNQPSQLKLLNAPTASL